jgi:hypothetical protein
MKTVSVSEAATFFGVSKEAIHNRIRRGSLEVALVDGIKMVVIDPLATPKTARRATPQKAVSNDERYYKLLQEQNDKLQVRVEMLEKETRSLRDQKELMLIEERKKIEQIYREKDEQLKNILGTLATQLMLTQPEPEHLEAEIEEVPVLEVKKSKVIPLKKYMKKLDISQKKQEKILKKFQKKEGKDSRIIFKDKKFYVDIKQFDYDDLIF